MNFLYELRDEELLNLVLNPVSNCRNEAIRLLRERKSSLIAHPAITPPIPEPAIVRDPHDEPKQPVLADPEETLAVMRKFPFTHLLDVVTADSIYSYEIRLGAAKLLDFKAPLGTEYGKTVEAREKENREFARIMAEARKRDIRQ